MKKLRIFLVAISIVAVTATWACGPDCYYDIYSDMFVMRTPIRDAIYSNNTARQRNDAETFNFWYKYTGGTINRDTLANAISELSYDTFLSKHLSDNALTAYLQDNKDNTALLYLRYNSELVYGTEGSEWEYHMPYTDQQWKSLYEKIGQLTASGKLADRIQYLKVRCMFKINMYNDIITLWKTKLHKMHNVDIRRRIEGYVGGSYFWTQRYNEAVDIFQRQGDIQSINSVVNKMLSTTSKEAIYAHDPNSLALEYAMQDYANIYYHCMANKRLAVEEPDSYDFYIEEGGVWETVTRDYNQTIDFAKKVVADGKTKNPMFWAGFIGFMEWANGDADDAYKWLEKAQKMKGDSQMAFCIRLYKLLAGLNMKKKPSGFDDYFLTEYRYFLDNSEKIANLYAMSDGYESISAAEDMADMAFKRELTEEAIGYYAPNGGLSEILLMAINEKHYGYYSIMNVLDKEKTIDEDILLLNQLRAGGKNKIEVALLGMIDRSEFSDDMFNDIIGTKMLRQMRFDEAQKYLSLVPLEYLNKQGIAEFLVKRTMPKIPFKRVNTEEYWDDDDDNSNNLLTTNVKLQFARDMASRQSKIQLLVGDAKAQAEYEFANYLFQASSLGDLWAMTEYGWTADDYSSELIPHIVAFLRDAEVNSKTIEIKKKVWFALASIPSGDQYVSWSWNDDMESFTWDFSNMTTWQRDAYRHLASNVTTSDPLYLSCDILRSYIRSYK